MERHPQIPHCLIQISSTGLTWNKNHVYTSFDYVDGNLHVNLIAAMIQ